MSCEPSDIHFLVTFSVLGSQKYPQNDSKSLALGLPMPITQRYRLKYLAPLHEMRYRKLVSIAVILSQASCGQ